MTLWQLLASYPEGERFVDAHARLAGLAAEGDRDVPARKWNKAVDDVAATAVAVRANHVLLESLKAVPREALQEDERQVWTELLTPPVTDLWDDPAALLADPRVGTTDIDIVRTVYLIEDPFAQRDGTVEGFPEARNLSHFGGLPLLVPGAVTPAFPLLAQVDLGYLPFVQNADSAIRTLGDSGVPADGVLQIFGAADSDSRTAPNLPGGGVVVRYLSENEVSAARSSHSTEDGDYPWRGIEFAAGVTVAAPVPTEQLIELATWMEEEAYRAARLGAPDPTGWQGGDLTPTRGHELPLPLPASHLLGAPTLDFTPDEHDVGFLHAVLPLQDAVDEHVLLIELAGVQTLEDAFGDQGRLQVWMRRSDIRDRRFDTLVSFLMSP